MSLPQCETLLTEQRDHALFITLNRPAARNAMNLVMVNELMACFEAIESNRAIRAVVLRGAKGHFCAGGDIKDFSSGNQDASTSDGDIFFNVNRQFGRMISQANRAPQVVIVVLEGAVMGGGFGLACISDLAIAHTSARFALPETSLGLPPAQIAPFVVARVGLTQARRLALFNQKLNTEQAREIGIVHSVANTEEELQQQIDEALAQVKQCAPEANAVTKRLLLSVGQVELEELLDSAAHSFSDAITQGEGPEGTLAFVEKRKAKWAE